MFEINEYLKTVIETMQDGLMVVDEDGEIVSVNQAMEELTGYRRKELIGSPCSILQCDVCFKDRAAGRDKHCDLFFKEKIKRRRCELRKKDGSPIFVIKNAAVLRDTQGKVIGGVETLTDLSDVVARDRVISDLRREMSIADDFQGIIGKSAVMQRIFDLIESAAQSEAPVLIMGESGTGKELAARAIHKLGPRSKGPFVTFNCAAFNEGLLESELFGHVRGAFTGAVSQRTGRFEAGHHGDIFLDEIGDLPLNTQVKLLRALQEKVIERVGDTTPVPVDVRIISATNKDLKAMMADGRFREDLYYRIGVIPIRLPPLRERRDDIPLLVETFIKRIAIRSGKNITGISPKALEQLVNYSWPGNIRELINAVEFAFVLCRRGQIQPDHLPQEITNAVVCAPVKGSSRNSNDQVQQKQEILNALEQTGGRKAEAANLLGISRVALWKRMKKYGLLENN